MDDQLYIKRKVDIHSDLIKKSMKKIAVLIVLIFLSALSGCLSTDNTQVDVLSPRENSEAGIKITVAYQPNITESTAFEIKVTSHKDYNDDFENISYIRDPDGKTYQPVSYEGSGGHHASGILLFPKIEARGFELVIRDVGGVKERVFKW